MHMALWGSSGGGRFLMDEVPLVHDVVSDGGGGVPPGGGGGIP